MAGIGILEIFPLDIFRKHVKQFLQMLPKATKGGSESDQALSFSQGAGDYGGIGTQGKSGSY